MSTETSISFPRVSRLDPTDTALLETLFKEAPIGLAFFSTDGRFRRVNSTLQAIYAKTEEECAGRTPGDILPADDAAAHDSAISAVLAGRPVVTSDRQLVGGPSAEGHSQAQWSMSWFPTYGPEDEIAGVALIAVDLSDQHKVETALRRSEERYRSLLRASNQVVWAAGPDGLLYEDCAEWRAITGQSLEEYLGTGWLDALHPDDRERVERDWNESVTECVPFDTTFRIRTRSGDFRYYQSRAVPIKRGSELVEWVGTNTDVTTQREADEMRHRLTQQLGEAALRTVRLQKATSDLAEALTVDEVVRAMAEIGRSAVGVDRTGVAMLDRERLRLRLVNADDSLGTVSTGEPETSLDQPTPMTMAVRDRTTFIAGSPPELRALLDDDPQVVSFLRDTDERAWVALPLLSAGLPIGALRFAFNEPRNISDEEKVFLEALAGQCALALERATLFEREHGVAESLQNSFLPEDLPEVKGIRMKAFYRSGSQHVQVGGDWYDAFPLPDGRVAGVLGDVMGKGIKAATGMSRVRNALRALAFSMPEPADVLTGLDRMFDATESADQITTLAYFVLDPATGHGRLANAGHLPPLLVSPQSGPVLVETEPATPLGVSSERVDHKFFVPPGNTVVLYSDGLVENRRRAVASGIEELVTVASKAPAEVVGDPEKILGYLVEGMLAGYEQDDDVTLLAVHIPAVESRDDN
ncbi:SpoIIE family protein phosphatase [Salinactinospora qingdaonensis]|uniref:PAS domain S-box-containing protein n=1 Tax=Salinactinospora qingdaonensis TaxID=702744 RepID=A0ABP7ESB9_9ACTN